MLHAMTGPYVLEPKRPRIQMICSGLGPYELHLTWYVWQVENLLCVACLFAKNHAGLPSSTRRQSGSSFSARFSYFLPEIDPGTPLDRPGPPRTSICTENQPRRPILKPFRDDFRSVKKSCIKNPGVHLGSPRVPHYRCLRKHRTS